MYSLLNTIKRSFVQRGVYYWFTRNILIIRFHSNFHRSKGRRIRIPDTKDLGPDSKKHSHGRRSGRASIVAQKRPPREHRARSLAGSHAFVMFIKYRLAGRHRRHRMTSTQLARSRSGSRPREPFALIGIATIKCVYSYIRACPRVAPDELCP